MAYDARQSCVTIRSELASTAWVQMKFLSGDKLVAVTGSKDDTVSLGLNIKHFSPHTSFAALWLTGRVKIIHH